MEGDFRNLSAGRGLSRRTKVLVSNFVHDGSYKRRMESVLLAYVSDCLKFFVEILMRADIVGAGSICEDLITAF